MTFCIRRIHDCLRILLGSFVIYCSAIAQAQSVADGVLVQPIQVAPHTYFVQGRPEMGSSANQNFISNAGFVVTPGGVVVIDALGSPVLAKNSLLKLIKSVSKKLWL